MNQFYNVQSATLSWVANTMSVHQLASSVGIQKSTNTAQLHLADFRMYSLLLYPNIIKVLG